VTSEFMDIEDAPLRPEVAEALGIEQS